MRNGGGNITRVLISLHKRSVFSNAALKLSRQYNTKTFHLSLRVSHLGIGDSKVRFAGFWFSVLAGLYFSCLCGDKMIIVRKTKAGIFCKKYIFFKRQ